METEKTSLPLKCWQVIHWGMTHHKKQPFCHLAEGLGEQKLKTQIREMFAFENGGFPIV